MRRVDSETKYFQECVTCTEETSEVWSCETGQTCGQMYRRCMSAEQREDILANI